MDNDIRPRQPKKQPKTPVKPRTLSDVKPLPVKPQRSELRPEPVLPPTNRPTAEEAKPVVPRKRRPWKRYVLAFFFAVVLAAGGGFAWWYNDNLRSTAPNSDEHVAVRIREGMNVDSIARALDEAGLIRSQQVFKWYAAIEGASNKLQAGVFRIKKSDDVAAIVKHLMSGKSDTFNVTFLPGATVADSKKTLIKLGYDKKDIDRAFQKTYKSSVFDSKPASADLEGYIYGETYNFPADTTPEQILERTFAELERVIDKNNLRAAYKKRGLSLYEGITLASIIQREEKKLSDQQKVAQVFFLRLDKGMPLGSDPTYQYIADKMGLERTPELDSPYNTRKVTGLPPGPIASPGETALIAVAKPAKGDYVYFLNGDDEKMYFARTLDEHEANIRNHCRKKCQIL